MVLTKKQQRTISDLQKKLSNRFYSYKKKISQRPPVIDVTGKKFNSWRALSYHCHRGDNSFWFCQCSCGAIRSVSLSCLIGAQSIACYQCKIKKYGKSKRSGAPSAEYNAWNNMKKRCRGYDQADRQCYTERGIKFCKRWLSFENFFLDMGPKPSPDHSLDRIDNNRGYFPSNCRWATRDEQNRNKRDNQYIVYKGKRMVVHDALKMTGINHFRVWDLKSNLNMSYQDALDLAVLGFRYDSRDERLYRAKGK